MLVLLQRQPPPGGAKALAGKAAMGVAKQAAVDKAVSTVANSVSMPKKKEPIAAGADLFDIVKGRLLDEGLTEEESLDVMLTLTLDEINEVIKLDEVSSELLMKGCLKVLRLQEEKPHPQAIKLVQ